MIVVDSTAACALLLNEPEADAFDEILARGVNLLPASCLVEVAITWRRRGGPSSGLDDLVQRYGFTVGALDERQARLAVEADRRYGRGSGHPARLNFGDCLAYAAAKSRGAALLYKGDDFLHTDVERAA